MTIRELITKVGFNVDDSKLKKIDAKVSGFSKKLDAFSKKMDKAGKKLSLRLTAPLAAAGIGILKVAGDFESAMNRVEVLTKATGATEAQFKKLREQAKHLGATTQFSATQAADAMGFLAQAGFDANKIYAAMPAVLNLAAASGQDLAVTADQVSNIMQAFALKAEDAGRVTDILAYTASHSNTDVTQLAEAMKYAAPVAKMLGLSLEETAAMAGFMGNAGIQASMAGTSMRQSFIKTIKQTPEATAAIEKLGISFTELNEKGEEQTRNFVDILADLQKAGATTKDINAIFDVRGMAGMGTILQQGTDELYKFIDALENEAGGTAAEQAAARMKGFNGMLLALKSALEAVSIAIADSGLLKFATDMGQKLVKFVQRLSKTNPRLLRMATIFGSVVAAIGPALILFGSVAGAIAKINTLMKLWNITTKIATAVNWLLNASLWANPITWVIAGIIALAAGIVLLWKHSEGFRKFMYTIWDGFLSGINFVIKKINAFIDLVNKIPGVNIGKIGTIEVGRTEKGAHIKKQGTGQVGGWTPSMAGDFDKWLLPQAPASGNPALALAGSTGSSRNISNSFQTGDINITVPPGTPKNQLESIKKVVREENERTLRHIQNANPEVE